MIRKYFPKVLVIVTLIALIGIGSNALAYRDGWGGCRGGGSGWSNSWFGAGGEDISDKDLDRMNDERRSFFEETSELRQDIYSKELELRTELEKEDADVKKAVALQRDLSELKAAFDQKQIEHRIKTREIAPPTGRGMRYGSWDNDRYYRGGPGYCWR